MEPIREPIGELDKTDELNGDTLYVPTLDEWEYRISKTTTKK